MAVFRGAGVALITPFDANEQVNYAKLEEIINFQIENGTDCIVAVGTTGEASTLSHEEHIEVIRQTVQFVNHRVPVIAGTGSNCTETAIYLSEEADKCGVDGILVVTPYYNKATQKGLEAHYTAVAKSVQCPLIMYNIPGRTGCAMTPQTVANLIKNVDNIVGEKDATGDLSHTAQVMYLTNGEADLYSGNDDQVLPMLSLGGLGVISVLSNVAPKQTHDMVMAYLNGDHKTALDIQLKAMPLINALFSEVNPIPVKKAMNQMGFDVGSLRAPLTEMEDAHAAVLLEELKKFGCIR